MTRGKVASDSAIRRQKSGGGTAAYLLDSTWLSTPHRPQTEVSTSPATTSPIINLKAAQSVIRLTQPNSAKSPSHSNSASSKTPSHFGRQAQPQKEKAAGQHAPSEAPAATSRSLPSLLRYVDHELMKTAATHDHPPVNSFTCPVCLLPWNNPIPAPSSPNSSPDGSPNSNAPQTSAVTSTFLPLSPCGHWMHYHCFIWLTTYPESDVKDKCFVCRTPLFEWEGMTALTLAARTNLSLEDCNKNGSWDMSKRVWIPSDASAYESDCALIVSLIGQAFFLQLKQPSRYADGSPDLASVYNQVLDELQQMKKPSARWLSWTTQTGSLLLGMLIALKMRRFLAERHGKIVKTAAWADFEQGGRQLQDKILEEVNKP